MCWWTYDKIQRTFLFLVLTSGSFTTMAWTVYIKWIKKQLLTDSIVKASIAFTWACFWSYGCHTCKESYCLHEFWWWHTVTEQKQKQKLWLVDAVIVIDHSPLLGQARGSLMNHPWPQKSEFKDESSDLKSLCPVRRVSCNNAGERGKLFLKHHL